MRRNSGILGAIFLWDSPCRLYNNIRSQHGMKLIQRWPIKLIQRWPIVQSCTAPHISNKILSSAITHGPINDGRPRSISSFSDCDKGRKRGRLGAVTSILLASVAFPPAQATGAVSSRIRHRARQEASCNHNNATFALL